jgi:putative hydrolase of the HAD superfamily
MGDSPYTRTVPVSPPPVHSGANLRFVFDFGGVLFRWQPHEIVASALPELVRSRAAADRLVVEIFQGFDGDWGAFDRGVLSPAELSERIARRTGLGVVQARAVIDAVPAALTPIAGTVDLLERLHPRQRVRGRGLYYLSNMPEPYAQHLEATHGFLSLFERGVFSARVRLIKPEAAIFKHAAEWLGIEPADSLFIDDMPRNVAAARAAGWQALLFENPADCECELAALGLL